MINIEAISHISTDDDFEQIKHLYLSNGWIDAGDGDFRALIEKIVGNTFCFAIARDEGKIIGMGRSISDGVSDAYIQDVTVSIDYRKQGIGGQIIKFLIKYMQDRGIGWIGLISVPGQQSFYSGLGFKEMEGFTPFRYEPEK